MWDNSTKKSARCKYYKFLSCVMSRLTLSKLILILSGVLWTVFEVFPAFSACHWVHTIFFTKWLVCESCTVTMFSYQSSPKWSLMMFCLVHLVFVKFRLIYFCIFRQLDSLQSKLDRLNVSRNEPQVLNNSDSITRANTNNNNLTNVRSV